MTATFDITPLRSLTAVASTGGVHRAAQSLLITQSAVSQHIRRLEKAAGVDLVSRSGRRITFTPAGEEMLAHARAILSAHDAAVVRFDNDSESVITIGAAQNSARVILPAMMARMRDAFPEVDVRFHLDRHATVRQLLDTGHVDVAVTTRVAPEIAPRADGFRLRWLWSSTVTMPAASDTVPLVVFSPPCSLRQPSFDTFSVAGRSWTVAAEVHDLASGLDAARAGAGAMLVPVTDRIPDGLVELADAPEPPSIQLTIVYTDRTRADVREALATTLADEVGRDRVDTVHSTRLAVPT